MCVSESSRETSGSASEKESGTGGKLGESVGPTRKGDKDGKGVNGWGIWFDRCPLAAAIDAGVVIKMSISLY